MANVPRKLKELRRPLELPGRGHRHRQRQPPHHRLTNDLAVLHPTSRGYVTPRYPALSSSSIARLRYQAAFFMSCSRFVPPSL